MVSPDAIQLEVPMGDGGTSCTFREFVEDGLRIFGGMCVLLGAIPVLGSVYFVGDHFWAFLDSHRTAITFAIADRPVPVFEFISYSLPIGLCLIISGVLMSRFSFSSLMDVLED